MATQLAARMPLHRARGGNLVPTETSPAQGVSGAQALRLCLPASYERTQLDSPRRVYYTAYPRLSARAEVLWSPPEQRDYDGFLARLKEAHLKRLDAMGVEYRPLNGPHPWQQRAGVKGWKRDYAAEQANAAGQQKIVT